MGRVKTITVFIDEGSEKQFKEWGINIPSLLFYTSFKFINQSIDIVYDFQKVKIKRWPRKITWWDKLMFDLQKFLLRKGSQSRTRRGGRFFGNLFHSFVKMQILDILEETEKLVRAEFTTNDPDIVLLIAQEFLVGNGFAKPKVFKSKNGYEFNGTGLICMGSYSYSETPKNKFGLIQKYAEILMHEQGHLYGLEHANERYTIMYPYSSSKGGDKFDALSKLALQKIIEEEKKKGANK